MPIDLGDRGNLQVVHALAHAHVDQHLRIADKRAGQLVELSPVAAMMRSTCSAVPMPSPVNRWSAKITCPDCSPPTASPRFCISSITYLSPTGARTSSMPRSRSASSSPMLLITVATMALPGRLPVWLQMVRGNQQHRVAIHDLAVPIDEERAVAVAVEGDAESRLRSTTSLCSRSRCVDPQSRLMLRPSGVAHR